MILQSQKIPQEVFSFGCQDRLRMKLHPVNGQFLVREAHDFALLGPCGDPEAVRQGVAFHKK